LAEIFPDNANATGPDIGRAVRAQAAKCLQSLALRAPTGVFKQIRKVARQSFGIARLYGGDLYPVTFRIYIETEYLFCY